MWLLENRDIVVQRIFTYRMLHSVHQPPIHEHPDRWDHGSRYRGVPCVIHTQHPADLPTPPIARESLLRSFVTKKTINEQNLSVA